MKEKTYMSTIFRLKQLWRRPEKFSKDNCKKLWSASFCISLVFQWQTYICHAQSQTNANDYAQESYLHFAGGWLKSLA